MNFQFPISSFQFRRLGTAGKILLAVLALAALFAAGLAVRRTVLSAQFAQYGRPLPFNLESALSFRYVRMLFETGLVPVRDQAVQAPEGVVVRATYTLGAEYVYAALARWLPHSLPLDERVRWIALSWFCLGIPLLSIWLWAWTKSLWAAGIAGAYYAVALSAVMRSTGQELSHENFALPLLIAHWALGAWANRIGEVNVQPRETLASAGQARGKFIPRGAGHRTTRDAWQVYPAQSGILNHAERVASTEFIPLRAGHRTPNIAFLVLSLFSALMLACAVATWDLIQYYLIIWALISYVRFVAGGYFHDARRQAAWWLTLLALAGAGLLNPYLRAHAFLSSYALLLAYGVALGLGAEHLLRCMRIFRQGRIRLRRTKQSGSTEPRLHQFGVGAVRLPAVAALQALQAGENSKIAESLTNDPLPGKNEMGQRRLRRSLVLALVALLPLLAGVFLLQTYSDTYNHFLSLLWAKLRFLNQKPADPALLTFDQRILWTAPLNSVNFLLTVALFPATLPLSLLAGTIAFFHSRTHPDPEIRQLLCFTIVSLLTFTFFMRFQVFAILGVAALLGWLGYWVSVRRSLIRWLTGVLLLAGLGVEAVQVLRDPGRWGSAPTYLQEKQELSRWLRTNAGGFAVLANFGLSAFLLAYADCPIVLHPKFESPAIRQRVRAYGEALFTSSEEAFRDWMEPLGVSYYVHARGEFADFKPESQMRYFVNALNPPPFAAARLLEEHPQESRYFRLLWENGKYRVFRVIRQADEQTARRLAAEAALALRRGQAALAEDKATQALMYDPQSTNAMQVLLQPLASPAGQSTSEPPERPPPRETAK